ncbi:MAG: outer membrane beta-barrel protein [Syntrophales bacterium]|nr:outer membrane beta-barrel protein [Syntrophales bacterium]MDD5641699.1 outer membrane beta-barrel protein [Syntrophales bacterium]
MKNYRGVWKLSWAGLAILAVLYSGVVTAAEEPGEKTPPAQVQEEEAPKKPEKPPEKPPELGKLLPSLIPSAPTTTFEAGPSMGILAPYGYSAAMETLSSGWQRHRLGPVTVAPFLGYDALYRTNIYQTSTNKKSDFINTLNPGLSFELPMAKKHKLSVGYLGNAFIYSRYGNNSHYDQTINADASFNFPRWSVRFGNGLRIATEERTAQNARQRDYTRESPYFAATLKFADRWRLEGNYQFEALTFAKQEDSTDNYQYHTMGWSLYYKFWPKTSALVQYVLLLRQHPNDSTQNNAVHTPMVGLTWDPTAKLSGTIKFGYTISDYYTKLPTRSNNPGSWAMSIQTLYRFSRYTNLALVAQRSIQEDADENNNAYVNTGLYLTLSHYFHYFKVNSYAVFSFYQNNYQENSFDGYTGEFKRRVDSVVSAGAGLSRPFTRWLRLRLDYIYNNKASNFGGFSYNEHRVLLGAQTSF